NAYRRRTNRIAPDTILKRGPLLKGRRVVLQGLFLGALAAVSLCFSTAAHRRYLAELPLPVGGPVLEVRGAITRVNSDGAAYFDMEMLKALPAVRLETTTAVTDGVHRFDGFLMRDLLEFIGAHGTVVSASAL